MLKWIGEIASLVSIWQVPWGKIYSFLISIVISVLSFWGVLKNGLGWQLALVFAFCVAIVFGYVLFILHCLAVIFYRKMKNSKIEKESELRIKEKEKDCELEKEKIKAKGEEERKLEEERRKLEKERQELEIKKTELQGEQGRKNLEMTFSHEQQRDIGKILLSGNLGNELNPTQISYILAICTRNGKPF